LTESKLEGAIPKIPIVVRAFEEEDRNFVLSAYMKDFWHHGIRGHHFRKIINDEGKEKTFAKSIRLHEHTPAGSFLPLNIYNEGQARIFAEVSGRSNIWIAANPADTWHCYGFLMAEEDGPDRIIHYLYVKGTFRRMGVASALLSEFLPSSGQVFYSHHTVLWFFLLQRLKKQGFEPIYNPYLAR